MENNLGGAAYAPVAPSFHFVRDLVSQAADNCVDIIQRYLSSGNVMPLIGAVGAISIGAAAMYLSSGGSSSGSLKIEPIVDLSNQTVIVDSDGSRVSAMIGSKEKLMSRQFDDATTLYDGFRRGLKMSNNGPCLGHRQVVVVNGKKGAGPYKWISYSDAIQRSENLARGFVLKGLHPGQNTFVGIYSQNRPEWIITEQACYFYSMVIVPLYDTLGPDACSYIINHTEMKLVVVDKSAKAENLLRQHAECPTLRVLVLMEAAESSLIEMARERGVEIVSFTDLEKMGSSAKGRTPVGIAPRPEDLCTISYTSGTTGLPKGVMLSHGNVCADCTGLAVLKYAAIDSTDTMMSFLPLAHMFERLLEATVYSVGGRVGFYRGDIKTLGEDFKELRPTFVPVVPRLLNRIHDTVMQQASQSRLKKYLIEKAVSAKTEELNRSIIRSNSYWDKIVFKRVREGMGGRVRLIICGSAPLSEHVLIFMRAAMGCVVLEGYGQTECVAPCTVTLEGDNVPGHVGPPIPCCQIKLVDVPELGYFSRNNSGEVCIKGDNVFKGYYKDAEKTAEVLDADGWLHTGDIGQWTETGTLKLIDRKKHIFKLAQGEYIAPEKVENVYLRSRFVGQIYVHGESLKSCLVAIVSPDPDVLRKYAEKELGLNADMVELCKNEKIKDLILADMTAEGKKGGLQSFEQVKDVHLHPEPFSVEAGLLTPTMKSKRVALKDYFKQELSHMYNSIL